MTTTEQLQLEQSLDTAVRVEELDAKATQEHDDGHSDHDLCADAPVHSIVSKQ